MFELYYFGITEWIFVPIMLCWSYSSWIISLGLVHYAKVVESNQNISENAKSDVLPRNKGKKWSIDHENEGYSKLNRVIWSSEGCYLDIIDFQ